VNRLGFFVTEEEYDTNIEVTNDVSFNEHYD